MLLEVIANGSVRSGQQVERVIKSSFLSHQTPYELLHRVTKGSLGALRDAKLISLVADSSKTTKESAAWKPTAMGRAIFASGLKLNDAVVLYQRLKSAQGGLVMGDMTHLIYTLMLERPVDIYDWEQWGQLFRRLKSTQREAAKRVGVFQEDIEAVCRGQGVKEEISTRHSCFAASCAIADLLQERAVQQVEEIWGKCGEPAAILKGGLSAGQLQKLQSDVAKTAAMASYMCQSAGWWQLDTLTSLLAQQASVGVRPDLLSLMRIPTMTAARARALHDRGITSPEALAAASVDAIEAAVEDVLPNNLKRQSKRACMEGQRGACVGQPGVRALVQRAAKRLVEDTCMLLVANAREAAEEARAVVQELADVDKVAQGTDSRDPQIVSCLVPSGGTDVGPPRQHHSSGACQGHVSVQQLSIHSSIAAIVQFMEAWASAPVFSWCLVHTAGDETQCDDANMPLCATFQDAGPAEQGRLKPVLGIAVCFDPGHVVYLDLTHKAEMIEERVVAEHMLWAGVGRVFSQDSTCKVGFGLRWQLTELMLMNVLPRAPLCDIGVAYALLHPELQEKEGARLHSIFNSMVRRTFFLQPLAQASVAQACQEAYMSFLLFQPVMDVLTQQCSLRCFQEVEMRCLCALAEMSAVGLNFHWTCTEVMVDCLAAACTTASGALAFILSCAVDFSTMEGAGLVLARLGVHVPGSMRRRGDSQTTWYESVIAALEGVLAKEADMYSFHSRRLCVYWALQGLSAQRALEMWRTIKDGASQHRLCPWVQPAAPFGRLEERVGAVCNVLKTLQIYHASVQRSNLSVQDEITLGSLCPSSFQGHLTPVVIQQTEGPLRVGWLHGVTYEGPRSDEAARHFGWQTVWLASVSFGSPVASTWDDGHGMRGTDSRLVPANCVWLVATSTNCTPCCPSILAKVCEANPVSPRPSSTEQKHMHGTAYGLPCVSPMSFGAHVRPSSTSRAFVLCSYWLLELSVLAHLSNDGTLLAAMAASDPLQYLDQTAALDPVRRTCAGLRNWKHPSVADSHVIYDRARSAPLVFSQMIMGMLHSLVYGWSPKQLSLSLGTSRSQALKLMAALFDALPQVKECRDNLMALTKRKGFVQTVTGRRLYCPQLSSSVPQQRAQAERRIFSHACSGSVADIIKTALTDLHRLFNDPEPDQHPLPVPHPALTTGAICPLCHGSVGNAQNPRGPGSKGSPLHTTQPCCSDVQRMDATTDPKMEHPSSTALNDAQIGSVQSSSLKRTAHWDCHRATQQRGGASEGVGPCEYGPESGGCNSERGRLSGALFNWHRNSPRLVYACADMIVVECAEGAMETVGSLIEDSLTVQTSDKLGLQAPIRASIFWGRDLDAGRWRRLVLSK
eukprot:evm.model.scf_171.4 EVM.evm.TU.scf_171.4   scf_171:33899-41036(+)